MTAFESFSKSQRLAAISIAVQEIVRCLPLELKKSHPAFFNQLSLQLAKILTLVAQLENETSRGQQ